MSTASRPTVSRPLSPHLQVYRPQLTSVLSISHRITGVAIAAGLLYLVVWVVSLAYGQDAYAYFAAFNGSWAGWLFKAGWLFCLFFHLCNGVRHLLWDAGKGLELEDAYRSGYAVVLGSVALTGLVGVVALLQR